MATAPVVCAAHCLAAPLLVLVLPVATVGSDMERILWGGTCLLAGTFLVCSVRAHRHLWIALPVVGGLAVWGMGLFDLLPVPETTSTVTGALLVAAGMIANACLRHRRVCGDCGCPAPG